MRAVIQRVSHAEVCVAGKTVSTITHGLLVLLGVQHGDTLEEARYMADKTVGLRIFNDEQGKMNRDVREQGGSVLVVSQFTLYGDCRKGRRPSFMQAAPPAVAHELYQAFQAAIAQYGVPVAHGCFGSHMAVSLVNDGPVTLLLESPPPRSIC